MAPFVVEHHRIAARTLKKMVCVQFSGLRSHFEHLESALRTERFRFFSLGDRVFFGDELVRTRHYNHFPSSLFPVLAQSNSHSSQ